MAFPRRAEMLDFHAKEFYRAHGRRPWCPEVSQERTQTTMEHVEAARYERLDTQEHLVSVQAMQEDGLVFEDCGKGPLAAVIYGPASPTNNEKSGFGKQTTRCLI